MKRLTRKDWELINAALAYFDAAGCGEEEGLEDAEVMQAQMPSTRAKVWDRIPG